MHSRKFHPTFRANGRNFILVTYDFLHEVIHVKPMHRRTKEYQVQAYKNFVNLLHSCKIKPQLLKLNNETSKLLVHSV